MDILRLDWNEYHKYIDKLADKIQTSKSEDKSFEYKYVAGLEPDDLFIAVHLSHRLGIPVITDINLLSMLTNFSDTNGLVLVVSNIVETGHTFESIMEQTGCQFDTAVIFKDENSNYKPTHYIKIPKEHIYFPWEKCGL
jgi:hypoxanthine phosphoribosyltransferase